MDAKIGHWHKDEFRKVLASEDDQMGVIFQCHSDIQKPSMERSMCAGWLLDQKKRDLPSISLRLSMRTDDSVAQAVQNVSDGGAKLYETARDMCYANRVVFSTKPKS